MRRFPILVLALGATTLSACMSDGAPRAEAPAPPAATAPATPHRPRRSKPAWCATGAC